MRLLFALLLLHLVACGADRKPAPEDDADDLVADAAVIAADGAVLADATSNETALDGGSLGHDGGTDGDDAARAQTDAASARDGSVDAGMVVVTALECVDSDTPSSPSTAGVFIDPRGVKGQARGIGGTIEDRCDAMGNLVEAECQQSLGCNKPGPCAPRWMSTGYVTSTTHDCLGMCKDGSCSLPCPRTGDVVTLRAGNLSDELLLVGTSVRLRCARNGSCATAGAVGTRQTLTTVGPEPACSHPFALQNSHITLSDGCLYVGCNIERLTP